MRFSETSKGVKWLLGFQILVALYIATRISLSYSNHYRIFTTAGSFLLHRINPYGVDWGYGGSWFYSPVCGWLFGLLSLLREGVGCFIFVMGSYFVFLYGCWRMVRKLPFPSSKNQFNRFLIVALILSMGEMIGALQSTKLEIAMIGLLLIAIDLIDSNPILAGVIAALIINFKWFPLAPIGLVGICQLRSKNYKFCVWTALFSVFFFVLPVAVYGWEFSHELYVKQNASLGGFMAGSFMVFPSVFGFLSKGLGITLSPTVIPSILVFLGGALGILVWALSGVRGTNRSDFQTLFPLALGVLYVVNFNPLSQFNAYMIATPALLYALNLWFRGEKKLFGSAIVLYWVIVSMFYSDLVPHSFRDHCRDILLKPVGSVVLLLAFVGFGIRALCSSKFRGKLLVPDQAMTLA